MHITMSTNSKTIYNVRRLRIKILADIMVEIKILKKYYERLFDMQYYVTIKEYSENTLALIIKLCGINDITNDYKYNNKEIMKKVILILYEI